MNTDVYLNPHDSALIVIDMQNDFCHEEGAFAKRGRNYKAFQAIVPNVIALINAARDHQVPVFLVQMTLDESTVSEAWKNKKGGEWDKLVCAKDSWGAEFYQIIPQPGDYIIEKHRYSAFIGTDLDLKLRTLKRKSIILTGVVTNICVESTARDGFMMDYNVTLVTDGCAAETPEAHQGTINNVDSVFGLTVTTQEVIDYWSKKKKRSDTSCSIVR